MKLITSFAAGLAALAAVASAEPIRIITPNDPAIEVFGHASPPHPPTLRKTKIGTVRPAVNAHDWTAWSPSLMDAQPPHHGQRRPHHGHHELPEWMSRILAPSRHRHAHHSGIVITTHAIRPDGSMAEEKDMSPYIMGFGNSEAVELDGVRPDREWHHAGEHHGRRACWKGRLVRAMSSLKPIELYTICFVFGAGLGSLARVFFMLFILLRRSHAYLNEPVAANPAGTVAVDERDVKNEDEKAALIANSDADDEELPAYQERPATTQAGRRD